MNFSKLFISAVLIYSSVSVSDFLFFDKGTDQSFIYGATTWCTASTPWEKQFQFSGTFANTPQVIVYPDLYNVDNPTTLRFVQIQTEITTITTTGFTYKVSCGRQDDIPKLNLVWYAFDEKKITIITSNIISNPVDGTIYTHSHTNSVATQGFVQMNSFRYEGSLNFYVELYQMSLYTVKVKIHNSSNNLSQLGYTIVIGPPDFIQASGLIDSGFVSATPFVKYQYWINSAPIDAVLLIIMTGIETQLNPIRFQFSSSINTVTQSTLINVQTWINTINRCYLYQVWLFQAKQLPLVCTKYRISRTYDQTNSYFIAFYLVELNLSYYDLNNNQQFTIAKDQNVINFVLEFVLPVGKKLKATMIRCNGCGPINYYQFEKKYTSLQNKVAIYATFQGSQSVEKYFILNISSTSLTIVQRINSAILTTIVEVLIL